MALTNTLKKQIDLPVWEWCRPCPIASAAGSTLTTADALHNRYMYYLGATFYRYDTISDSWAQLTSPPTLPTTAAQIKYDGYRGYYGRAISCPTNNKLRIAGLHGKVLNGYKIRIISGTGAGQERTIIDVDTPIIWDRCLATTISTSSPLSLTDSTRNWKFNEWRDYQVRIVMGTGIGTRQTFKIQYNSNNSVYVADGNYQGLEPFIGVWYRAWTTNPATTAGNQTIFQIESSDITVDVPWNTNPDNTSRFLVMSGGIWYITGGTAFTMYYYDIISDAWYYKTSQGANGITHIGALATDVCMEKTGEFAGAFLTGSATSGSLKEIIDANLLTSASNYTNYRIRITNGAGIGQERTILSSSNDTTFSIVPPFTISPLSESQYSVYGDTDKIWWTGNACSAIYKYSKESDIHTVSPLLDYGTPSRLCFTWDGMPTSAQPITSITRSAGVNSVYVTTPFNHCLSASNTIQLFGATDPLYNVTASILSVPSLTTFTYTMSVIPSANAVPAGPALSTTVMCDPSKNWIPNEFSESIVIYQSATVGTAAPVFRANKIVSNTTCSLTTLTSSAAPIVLGKYAICSPIAFGTYYSGSYAQAGSCTSVGTTTTVIDATKNWITNQWAGYRVKFIAGTNHGTEVSITSNTNNTLTLATAVTATDTTTTYCILGSPIKGVGNNLLWTPNYTGSSGMENYMYCFPGGGSSQITRFNISSSQWELIDWYPHLETLGTGTSCTYDGSQYIYFQVNSTGRIYRFDIKTLVVEPCSTIPYGHSTAIIGNRMELIKTVDGLMYLYHMRNTGVEMWRTLVFW